MVEHDGSIDAASSRNLGQVPHARERGAVIVVTVADVELAPLIQDVLRVLRGVLRVHVRHNRPQVLNVVFTVEGAHLADGGTVRLIDVQLLV